MLSPWKPGDVWPVSAWPDWASLSASAIKSVKRDKKKRPYILYAFLDETGDALKDNRVFMCGFAGWRHALNGFSGRWDKELKSDELQSAGIRWIHATELFSQCGSFAGWDSTKADAVAARLIDAIRTKIPVGIAVGFDVKHYRALTNGQRQEIGKPFLACMSRAIDVATGIVGELRARGDIVNGINLLFDDSEKSAVEMLTTWIQLKRARPQLVDYIASVGFADDKRFYPLQAADMLANLTNRYWKPELLKKPESSDRAERHLRNLLTADPSFPLAYRVSFITAADMDKAVRLHRRLY